MRGKMVGFFHCYDCYEEVYRASLVAKHKCRSVHVLGAKDLVEDITALISITIHPRTIYLQLPNPHEVLTTCNYPVTRE